MADGHPVCKQVATVPRHCATVTQGAIGHLCTAISDLTFPAVALLAARLLSVNNSDPSENQREGCGTLCLLKKRCTRIQLKLIVSKSHAVA
jgi:hypothetical protein